MSLLRWLFGLMVRSPVKPGATVSLVLNSGYNADKPIQRDNDFRLSDHFGLFELTVTLNSALQSKNRLLSDNQIQKLTKLARMAEAIRDICGGPLRVHSGYRCLDLNGATVGSASTSQHPRCEAIDFDIVGQDLEQTFRLLRGAAAAERFQFGQLILEIAERSYGVSRWAHCSVIGTLDPEKIGEVMTMSAGADGKSVYTLVEKLSFPRLTIS